MKQLIKSLFVVFAMQVGLAIAVPCSCAGLVLYQTDFEPPTFSLGVLVGQDNWTAPPPLSPNAAVISTALPRLGTQSVLVPGANLVHQDFINSATSGYYDAIGSYRQSVNYDTAGTQTVRVSAEVRVDGPLTSTNFFSASIVAVAPNGEGVGELAISSDGNVHAYSGDDLVPSFFTSAPVSLGEWHLLAVEANFATRQSSFFVDDLLLGSFGFDPSITSNLLDRGSMVTYAAPDTDLNQKSGYSAHFDQFEIEVVPLPPAALLLGSGLLGLAGLRRLRKS